MRAGPVAPAGKRPGGAARPGVRRSAPSAADGAARACGPGSGRAGSALRRSARAALSKESLAAARSQVSELFVLSLAGLHDLFPAPGADKAGAPASERAAAEDAAEVPETQSPRDASGGETHARLCERALGAAARARAAQAVQDEACRPKAGWSEAGEWLAQRLREGRDCSASALDKKLAALTPGSRMRLYGGGKRGRKRAQLFPGEALVSPREAASGRGAFIRAGGEDGDEGDEDSNGASDDDQGSEGDAEGSRGAEGPDPRSVPRAGEASVTDPGSRTPRSASSASSDDLDLDLGGDDMVGQLVKPSAPALARGATSTKLSVAAAEELPALHRGLTRRRSSLLRELGAKEDAKAREMRVLAVRQRTIEGLACETDLTLAKVAKVCRILLKHCDARALCTVRWLTAALMSVATGSSLHDAYSPSDDALGVALDETASQSSASSTSSFTSESSGSGSGSGSDSDSDSGSGSGTGSGPDCDGGAGSDSSGSEAGLRGASRPSDSRRDSRRGSRRASAGGSASASASASAAGAARKNKWANKEQERLRRRRSAALRQHRAPAAAAGSGGLELANDVVADLVSTVVAAFEEPVVQGLDNGVVLCRPAKSAPGERGALLRRRSSAALPAALRVGGFDVAQIAEARAAPGAEEELSDRYKLIDFRQVMFQVSKACPCEVRERIALFFNLYGSADGTMAISGVCALLYWGDRVVARSLVEAEKFMRRLDKDGDGSITYAEFSKTVEEEPLILESIVRKHNEEYLLLPDTRALRSFVHRASLSWAGICQLWERLLALAGPAAAKAGGGSGGTGGGGGGGVDVATGSRSTTNTTNTTTNNNAALGTHGLAQVIVMAPQFERELFARLQPPQPDDGPLVRALVARFKVAPAAPAPGQRVAAQQQAAVQARSFVTALASALGELNIGISDSKDKARFYFSLYNVDGDDELSREEIYMMLYSGSGEMGRRIMDATAVLRSLDEDGDNCVSMPEYVRAAESNPGLLEFFQPYSTLRKQQGQRKSSFARVSSMDRFGFLAL